MKPDNSVILDGVPQDGRGWVLAQPPKAWAIYLKGRGPVELSVQLPAGVYRAEWINPLTGITDKKESFNHPGGPKQLSSPDFLQDAALRIRSEQKE